MNEESKIEELPESTNEESTIREPSKEVVEVLELILKILRKIEENQAIMARNQLRIWKRLG